MREALAPTKSNLIHIKERLSIACEGYELLEQKREILVMALMRKVERVKILERNLISAANDAYPALKRMFVVAGRAKTDWISRNINYSFSIKELHIKEAGINMPGIEVTLPSPALKYSLGDSIAEYDETTLKFFSLLEILTELASVRTIAWKLAHEVRKTQRRVNALEKLVIPVAKETKIYIEAALEEKERDTFFSSKMLKKRKETAENVKSG